MSGKKGRKCSMINCSSFQHTHKHLSFFRFPKDPARCNIWIKNSGRPELADKTAVYEDRICELHFDAAMFLNDYRNRLHQAAVPNPLLVPSAALAAPTDSSSEPPMKRQKHNMGSGGMTEALNALTYANNQVAAHKQQLQNASAPGGTTPPPTFPNNTSQQQAYVIAAHAVQTNVMPMLMAAEKFGVDFETLRRFCRRIEKTIGKPPQNQQNPFLPFDASAKNSMEPQMRPTDKVHKKQHQLARLEQEIMMKEKMLLQQKLLMENTELSAIVTSPAAAKEAKKSSPALKQLDTSGQHTRRPRQIFSLQQEEELATFVRETSDYYNGMSSKDVRTLAFVYATCNRVEIPAGWKESSEASFDWCLGFIKRNKLSPMMTTSNMYKDKSMNGKVFGDANPETEAAEC